MRWRIMLRSNSAKSASPVAKSRLREFIAGVIASRKTEDGNERGMDA